MVAYAENQGRLEIARFWPVLSLDQVVPTHLPSLYVQLFGENVNNDLVFFGGGQGIAF